MLDSVLGAGEEHSSTHRTPSLCATFLGVLLRTTYKQELHKQPVTTATLLPQPLSWQHRGAVKRNEYTFSSFHLKMDEKLEEKPAFLSLYIHFFTYLLICMNCTKNHQAGEIMNSISSECLHCVTVLYCFYYIDTKQ